MAIIKNGIGRNAIVDKETGECLAFFDGPYILDTKGAVTKYCKKNGYEIAEVEYNWDCILVYVNVN